MTISSIDPRDGRSVVDVGTATTDAELDAVCSDAVAAAAELDRLGRAGRSRLLRSMADALEAERDTLVIVADRETALGRTRLDGELTRTAYQLRFFSDVLADGGYLEAAVDHAGPTPMGPRADLRRILRPLGPVAVFGASNFPFAFSVPGGDTASALAAGCPVLAKVHEAHPATSVATHAALVQGALEAGAPAACVGLVLGQSAGLGLIRHDAVRAVGFTGSVRVGRLLADEAASRPRPVPFYGELGALNAVVVCPDAAVSRVAEIADGLVASFTLGVGQFCTKPGLVLLPGGPIGDALVSALAERVSATEPAIMLSARTAEAYAERSDRLTGVPGVHAVAAARGGDPDGHGFMGVPRLLAADIDAVDGLVVEECFGPVLVTAAYRSAAELGSLLDRVGGALTGTVHATDADAALAAEVVERFTGSVGRVVWNGYPTGVAVAWAMHHGGPFPASTDPLHTSVGAAAIRRWLRPVCYQDIPQTLLPSELRDGPCDVPRRVDGVLYAPETVG